MRSFSTTVFFLGFLSVGSTATISYEPQNTTEIKEPKNKILEVIPKVEQPMSKSHCLYCGDYACHCTVESINLRERKNQKINPPKDLRRAATTLKSLKRSHGKGLRR